MSYSVRDEPDFEPTYDEDEVIQVRKGDLRAVLDVATMSMNFASGFLDNEQVEALRKAAVILGIDPLVATPDNFVCQYTGRHAWQELLPRYWCAVCQVTTESPTDPRHDHGDGTPHQWKPEQERPPSRYKCAQCGIQSSMPKKLSPHNGCVDHQWVGDPPPSPQPTRRCIQCGAQDYTPRA